MLDDREKQNQKSHWRAIAEQLGLPTEPEEELVSEPSPTEPVSEPEEQPTIPSETAPAEELQEPPRREPWPSEVSESRFGRPRPGLYREPIESEERQEPTRSREEEEPEIIVTEGFIEHDVEEEEPEALPRRKRRRGRRGKRSGQKEKREMGSGEPSPVLDEEGEPEPSKEMPIMEVTGDEPDEGFSNQEEPSGEKTRRRRRSRSRHRDKKQKGQGRGALTEPGDELEGIAQEEEFQESIAEGLAETRDSEEFAEAEEQEEKRKSSKVSRQRKEVKDEETEEADYDIMDEGPTDFSDWNVPSWQELIASLYRPER